MESRRNVKTPSGGSERVESLIAMWIIAWRPNWSELESRLSDNGRLPGVTAARALRAFAGLS